MTTPRLEELNLNLLLAMHWLLHEHGVTAASRRMGLTQSAMSRSLAQLRALFDDPLLVTTAGKMLPTPLALSLQAPLSEAIDRLRSVLQTSRPFEPAEARGPVRIAATEHAMAAGVDAMIRKLLSRAPQLDVAVELAGRDVFRQLSGGTLDLLVAPRVKPPASGIAVLQLLRERFVTVVRRGHPLAGKRWTLARFRNVTHVLVRPVGGDAIGAVDQALHRRGLQRRVAVQVPYFSAALRIVAATDLVVTLPASLVTETDAFFASAPPLDVPGFLLEARWPRRLDEDPQHRWLRDQLVASMQSRCL